VLTLVPFVGGIAGLIFFVYSGFLCSNNRVRGVTLGSFVGVIIAVPLVLMFGDQAITDRIAELANRK
jgi:hypothetical protein